MGGDLEKIVVQPAATNGASATGHRDGGSLDGGSRSGKKPQQSPGAPPPVKTTEPEEEDDGELQDTSILAKSEMEAVQEARQLAQMKMAWRWTIRTLFLISLVGTLVLVAYRHDISTKFGGATPWRWGCWCTIVFGGRQVMTFFMDLVMLALDRKHVIAKRVSFILGGVFTNLTFTLYAIVLRVAWEHLLRSSANGDGGWSGGHELVQRICSCLIAWGITLTAAKALSRYLEVYFQRAAYFQPIMRALAEEFVVMTLLAVCSVDLRQWASDHGYVDDRRGGAGGAGGADDYSPGSPNPKPTKPRRRWWKSADPLAATTSAAEGGSSGQTSSSSSSRQSSHQSHQSGLLRHFGRVRGALMKRRKITISLSNWIRLTKETLPIKTDQIVMKEGSIGPADMSLARLQRMSQHVRRRVIHLPEKFVKNANRVHVRGDLPKIVDEQIVHRSVASTTALRMIAVMRQLQGARRFVPLDHDFFNTMGLPRQVQEKVMEVLDVDGVGSLKRDQIVRRFVEIYEKRRDLARSLDSATSVLATLDRIVLTAFHVVLLFIAMAIFDMNIMEMWFTVSSVLLAFAFMFGNSVKVLFESIIFIFIVHSFDIGDNILINGERHVVRNISIMNTETTKWNGQVIYYPNTVLNTAPLVNLTRTKHLTDEQTWVVDIHTSARVFEALPLYLHAFQMSHAEDFLDCTPRIYSHADDPLKIKLTVYYEYSFNGLPPARAGKARDKLGLAMRKFLIDNGVVYKQQPLPVEILSGPGGTMTMGPPPPPPSGGGGGGGGGGNSSAGPSSKTASKTTTPARELFAAPAPAAPASTASTAPTSSATTPPVAPAPVPPVPPKAEPEIAPPPAHAAASSFLDLATSATAAQVATAKFHAAVAAAREDRDEWQQERSAGE